MFNTPKDILSTLKVILTLISHWKSKSYKVGNIRKQKGNKKEITTNVFFVVENVFFKY